MKPKTMEIVDFIERFRAVTKRQPDQVWVSLEDWYQLSIEHGLSYPIDKVNGVPLKLRDHEPRQ